MSKDKLRYVKGYCELEDGIVKFVGGMGGVSDSQCWYYIIYAIRDRFPKIDYWIDPKMEECRTLPSTMNHLRYGICKSLKCTFEPFPNGEIRPKKKLSEFDKSKYKENRSKVDSRFIPVLEFELVKDENNSKNETMKMNLGATPPTQTLEDYDKGLRRLLKLSLEVFNGTRSIVNYKVEVSLELDRLKLLVDTIDYSDREFTRTRVCANKIAGWSNKASNEALDNALTDTAIELLKLSNTLKERGVSGVQL